MNKQERDILSFYMVGYFICTLVLVIVMCGVVYGDEISMDRIATIESSNNPNAYNQYSGAKGLYQITDICLQDYNQYHSNGFTTKQLYDVNVNYTIANWYMNKRIPQLLRHYNQADTVENRLIAYNCGIGCVLKGKLPKETRDYIKKYNRLN